MYSFEKKVYIKRLEYLNVYDAILYLVKICPQLDYHYICSKLRIDKVEMHYGKE